MAGGEFELSDMIGCSLGFVIGPGSNRFQREDKEPGRSGAEAGKYSALTRSLPRRYPMTVAAFKSINRAGTDGADNLRPSGSWLSEEFTPGLVSVVVPTYNRDATGPRVRLAGSFGFGCRSDLQSRGPDSRND